MLKAQLQKAPIPPAFANFLTIPDLIVSAEAQLSLLGGSAASLTLCAGDEQSAKQLESLLNALLDMAKNGRRGAGRQVGPEPGPH